MRTLTSLLLCLMVAFQGIANAYAFQNLCLMDQTGNVMTMEAADTAGGCCNDAETAAKTGKLCKTGQECNLSLSGVLTTPSRSTPVPALSCLVPTVGRIAPSFDHSDVWRPPTFS